MEFEMLEELEDVDALIDSWSDFFIGVGIGVGIGGGLVACAAGAFTIT